MGARQLRLLSIKPVLALTVKTPLQSAREFAKDGIRPDGMRTISRSPNSLPSLITGSNVLGPIF